MSKLLEKLSKTTNVDTASVLSESIYFGSKSFVSTPMPVLNAALSSAIERGLTSGISLFCGPSKHFKTQLALMCVAAFLKSDPEAVCVYYDSEFGSPPEYLEQHGIDPNRILHIPVSTLEELRSDIVNQLDAIERGEKVIFMIDSLGNLASKKEVDDAKEGNEKADMTRAKVGKSLMRIITPKVNMKDVPVVGIQHVYNTMEMYSKPVVSGGCVVAGTLILDGGGNPVSVEDYKKGDTVTTLSGESIVSNTWTPETLENGNPECIEIEFEDGYKVVCSENHKFLINGKWIEAKDMCVGHDVKNIRE